MTSRPAISRTFGRSAGRGPQTAELAPARRPAPGASSGWSQPGLRWFLLVWLAALIALAANHPGQLVFDTKLGVDIDPAGFYARLWDLWDPLEWLGTLQNQYIGYAFPMAPFYLVSHALGVPGWLTERLWMSLLVAVGFLGLARLAAALRIGSPRTRLLAGLAFALWPTFTILVGSTSASILPGIMAPWAVLPLVRATRGATPGDPRAGGGSAVIMAAARSGAAVLCMGGVNAVVTLEALIGPALFIVLYTRGRRRTALGAAWTLAVALATSWWAGPLLLQGRYSFSFLPYIEQAATTTATMSATTTLLGSGDWTAYFNPGSPWLTAGWTMISVPAAVLASAAVAAAGLAGLARRDLPRATWLRLAAGIAAAGALPGYWGPLGGPFHGTVDSFLNGVLAPLRNVYKFESVLALVLALSLAHGLTGWSAPAGRLTGRAARLTRRRWAGARLARAGARLAGGGAAARRPPPWRLIAVPAVAVVLAGLALPYLTDQVLSPGSFSRVPRYWDQVAGFLAAHSPREPAFVVPGDAHGEYLWGSPQDDPLEPLARSPWVERGLVPYGGAGSQDFINTAESAIESGEQVPGLAAYLARAGVRYVVVRNDLSPDLAGYTAPQVVHATLTQSGFRRVAAFGPRIPVAAVGAAAAVATAVLARLPGAAAAYPAVEVYAAPGQPASGPAQVQPVGQAVLVDGGPDALLQLAGQGVLGGRPAVLAGDPLVTAPARWAVTDGARRADNVFGLISGNVSETYTATQVNPPDEQLGDPGGPPRQLRPVPARLQTVAVLSGAAAVTASSVGSWVTESPQFDPVNAFDGNGATAWTVGVPRAAGQWLQVTFGRRRVLGSSAGIRLLADLAARPAVTRVTVRTAAGRVSTGLRRTSAVQRLRVPPGATGWLRVTITRTTRPTIQGITAGLGAGVSDVLIPGVRVRRLLRPAQDQAGRPAAVPVFSFAQQLPSPALLGSAAAYPPLARTFATTAAAPLRLTATAVALPGRTLTALLRRLAPAGPGQVQVTATSTLGSLPSLFPAQLLATPNPVSPVGSQSVPGPGAGGGAGGPNSDTGLGSNSGSGAGRGSDNAGSAAGQWIAASAHPVLTLSWTGNRRIADLILAPDAGVGAFPQRVTITSPAGPRTAAVGFGGLVTLSPPLVTDRISISFPATEPASAAAAAQRGRLPVALSRLTIPGLAGLHPALPDPAATFRLPCGQGPTLTVDGRSYATAVTGHLADLISFRPVQVRLCPAGSGLSLPPGRHQLTATPPAPFALTSLTLTGAAGGAQPGTASRAIRVVSWQPDRRSLHVAAGRESYLELHQNANPGWVATLNGRRLTPATLDGWQQGYVLPAGGGVVTLTYAPDGFYHGLLAAAALGVLLLLAAARPRFRRRPGRPAAAAPLPGVLAAPIARAGIGTWAGLAAVAALVFAAGGPVVAVVPVLTGLAWWRPRWRPAAAAGLAAAGVITATAADPAALGSGAFSAAAQACALTALAAALLPTFPAARTAMARSPAAPDPAVPDPAVPDPAAPDPAAGNVPSPDDQALRDHEGLDRPVMGESSVL